MELAPKGTLRHRWDALHTGKGNVIERSEQYAAWTLPHIFPPEFANKVQTEVQLSNDSIGARGVNHLANRLVSTLFRPNGPFFRLALGQEQRDLLEAMSQDSKKADVAGLISELDKALSKTELKAMEMLNMIQFRTNSSNTAKLLIITGNALEYHREGGITQVYSLRDYSVVRDVEGNVIEIMTRDSKAFETFSDEVQAKLKETNQYSQSYEDKTQVTIYTQVRLETDGKYHVKQAADLVDLDLGMASWPKDTLPWIPLTWNLARGDDYGRGLVEDFAGAFHSIEVMTQSLINIVGVMGNIQFLVKPSSLVDVAYLNNAPAGSYHSGSEGDVTAIETNKQNDAQFILSMIERYTKQIGEAFLLNSAVTRDAERVTAEEIRLQAQELETSHGNIYSRLAHTWQMPLARLLLDFIDFDGEEFGVEPSIITGMDTMSRQGEMESWYQWAAGFAVLEQIPEEFRRVINPLKWAEMLGKNHQVEFASVCYTDQELQAQAEQAQAQEKAMIEQQAQANVAQAAGQAAVQGE